MTRYAFDLSDTIGQGLMPDEYGAVFDTLDEALEHAAHVIRETVAQAGSEPADWAGWICEVSKLDPDDETVSEQVALVPFSDVVPQASPIAP